DDKGQLRDLTSDRCFQSAETEIVIARIQHAPRKIETRIVARQRASLNLRTTGITEAEHLRHFIERLASSVIHRPAEDAVPPNAAHIDEERVPSADDERHVRLDFKIRGKKWREQVALQVIHREIRFSETNRETLCDRRTDHERADQPRPGRRREHVHFTERDTAFFYRAFEKTRSMDEMIPRGHFGDDTAVGFVLSLRRDLTREQFIPA